MLAATTNNNNNNGNNSNSDSNTTNAREGQTVGQATIFGRHIETSGQLSKLLRLNHLDELHFIVQSTLYRAMKRIQLL